MFWFTVDIAMVIIVIITTLVSLNRGFVSSFVRVIGVFIAIFLSVLVARAFSELIFTSIFRESLVRNVAAKIDFSAGLEKAFEALQTGVIGLLLGLFGSREKLETFFLSNMSLDKTEMAGKIVDGVMKDPIVSLIKVILCLISFSIIILIIILIAKAAGLFNAVPVFGGLNKFFGALLGIVYGIIICVVISSAISFFLFLTSPDEKNLPLIERYTYILSWFMRGKLLIYL